MNNAQLIGRLTKDPEIKYINNDQMAVATFTLAVDRHNEKKETDFIRCKAFGKTAENLEKFTGKGCRLGVTGRIQTGSYTDKEGLKVFTTDIIVDRADFLDYKNAQELKPEKPSEDFQAINEKVPF